jgi:hypothetical protein
MILLGLVDLPQWLRGRGVYSLDDFLPDGKEVLSRLMRSAELWGEKKSKRPEVMELEENHEDMDLVSDVVGPSIVVFSRIGNETAENTFLNGSMTADAKAWSAYIIPYLAEKGQEISRNQVQIALERLTVSARIEDLQFAHKKISEYKIPLYMFDEITRAEMRLVFYLALCGDESMRPYLLDDFFFVIRCLIRETDGLMQRIL